MCICAACVCTCVCGSSIFVPSSIHVRQLFEAGAPVVEVVIVLVSCAGGVEGADGAARSRTPAGSRREGPWGRCPLLADPWTEQREGNTAISVHQVMRTRDAGRCCEQGGLHGWTLQNVTFVSFYFAI